MSEGKETDLTLIEYLKRIADRYYSWEDTNNLQEQYLNKVNAPNTMGLTDDWHEISPFVEGLIYIIEHNGFGCEHPADYLVIRNVLVDRDTMEKPVSLYTDDPTDFTQRKYMAGVIKYKVLCTCTKCKSDVYIFGTEESCP